MASTSARKPCAKCSKGVGVAICDGCQQSFCIKHFGDHRQELSHQLENIGLEHDLLRKDLDQYDGDSPLLDRINTWEEESVAKIQAAAQTARVDLREVISRHKEEMTRSIGKITDELQSTRESYDYTEIDMGKWTEQLGDLRKKLESPPAFGIAEDESIIRLIRVHEQQGPLTPDLSKQPLRRLVSRAPPAPEASSPPVQERFDAIDGKAKVSADNLLVTCYSKTFLFPSIIYGGNRYSSGTRGVHFRIENMRNSVFVGISTASEKIGRGDMYDRSLYGWWDLGRVVVAGQLQTREDQKIMSTGDVVTLALDCDNRQIHLKHHRTMHVAQLPVDINVCPSPWKIVVKLRAEGDSIRIVD